MSSARNRELTALVPVAILLTAGFAGVFAQEDTRLDNLSLIYGAYFLAVCVATHVYLRIRLPNADPYLFPLVALLTAFGLVMIYRIDDALARDQANWFVLGLILFALTIQLLREYEVLERYRYTIAGAGLLLLLAPRLPGIGQQVNGAYLGIKIGPLAFQPAEFSKIAIVVFLASYLREHREVLIVGAKRVLGVTLPPLKHFGPMLVVWGASMFMLVFIRDLGSSLMFFAAFLALLYVATGRFSFVVIGMAMFTIGAWFFASTVPHVHDRVEIWLDPYVDPGGTGYQILQSIFAQADGGLFGKGFGQALITIPGTDDALLPAAQTDTIYSLIVNELGLFGACGVVLIYLLIAARGFKIALLARDGFSKLLATGLTAVFSIQAFVIIGGVTRVIPLTGVTLPFISYGGSSIIANFVLLALLLLISDRARREALEPGGRALTMGARMNPQIVKLFSFIVVLFAVLVGFTSYWSVFDAEALKDQEANKRPLLEQQQIRRGRILAADGTVIAKSVAKGKGDAKRFVRRYPEGALYGHPVGYSFVRYGDSEFEQFHNDQLVGEESEFSSILDELRGRTQEGNDIVTSIDPAAQRTALADLEAAGFGAVVAIEPSTGAVKVMASNRSFDPNRVPYEFGKLSTNEIERPLYNRASQGQYPPGSTFKVVTAAAGLESGAITPETTIDAPGTLEVEDQPLNNDFSEDFGAIPLDTALTNSVNTWFGQLGQRLGNDRLFETMEKFGFSSTPPIDLPEDQVGESGVFGENGELLTKNDPVDLARVAIGQERLLATPLQMAMVAAGVANGGKLMKPQIWKRVVDPDGRTVDSLDPSEYSQPISSETAAELTTAMEGVVSEGTGTNAAIPGVSVAGKTGTAETPGNKSCGGGVDENQAWFIGFAPADDPQIAIAASVECTEQFGNDVAAPIFADVAEAILNGE